MDTRQLAAFCAVVERKSFSQAAEQLGVTQPAVSLQIGSLEKRLPQEPVGRSRRGGGATGAPFAAPRRSYGRGSAPLSECAADACAGIAAARGARRRRRGSARRAT